MTTKGMPRNWPGMMIPPDLWFSDQLNCDEKFLILEINSLDRNQDGCFAKNAHFGRILGKSKNRVSELISGLHQRGFIYIYHGEIEQGGQPVRVRKLRLTDKIDMTIYLKANAADLRRVKDQPPGGFDISTEGFDISTEGFDISTEGFDISTDIYNVLSNTLTITLSNEESELTAFGFLHKHNRSRLDVWMMQNIKSVNDPVEFIEYFNIKARLEKLAHDPQILLARLDQLLFNWRKKQGPDAKYVLEQKQRKDARGYDGEII